MDYYLMFVTNLDTATPAARKAHTFFWEQIESNDLCVSPSLRLCGSMKNAHINSRELAEKAHEVCEKIFKQKYGEETEIKFYRQTRKLMDKRLEKRIEKDSSKLAEKLGKIDLAKQLAPTKKDEWIIEITGKNINPMYLISIKNGEMKMATDKDQAKMYVSKRRIDELVFSINDGYGSKFHARPIKAFTRKPKLELV